MKIYQGQLDPGAVAGDVQTIPRTDAQRLERALPFRGSGETFEFARNQLSFGSIYFQSGYLAQAEASFLLALTHDPVSAEANYGLGSVYLKQDKLEVARLRFQEAVNGKPSYPDTLPNAWNNLGLISARTGKTEEAIGYFEQALKVSPDYSTAVLNLGNALSPGPSVGQGGTGTGACRCA